MSGCAKFRLSGGDRDEFDAQPNSESSALTQYELIAIDMVNAMVQINELRPTTLPDIKITASEGSFGGALFTVLGFGWLPRSTIDFPNESAKLSRSTRG